MIDFLIRVSMERFQLLTREFVTNNNQSKLNNNTILLSSGAIAQTRSLTIIQRIKIKQILSIGLVKLELLIASYLQVRTSPTFLRSLHNCVDEARFLQFFLLAITNVDGIICLKNKLLMMLFSIWTSIKYLAMLFGWILSIQMIKGMEHLTRSYFQMGRNKWLKL